MGTLTLAADGSDQIKGGWDEIDQGALGIVQTGEESQQRASQDCPAEAQEIIRVKSSRGN